MILFYLSGKNIALQSRKLKPGSHLCDSITQAT